MPPALLNTRLRGDIWYVPLLDVSKVVVNGQITDLFGVAETAAKRSELLQMRREGKATVIYRLNRENLLSHRQ
jgi:hypothetical protein